jgi:hypothetical protein
MHADEMPLLTTPQSKAMFALKTKKAMVLPVIMIIRTRNRGKPYRYGCIFHGHQFNDFTFTYNLTTA